MRPSVTAAGASSGVGLSGSKLLTAAGHDVTLACRTAAKAEAAAAACNAYAASGGDAAPATGAPGFNAPRRAGGRASAAACDLTSLESVRAFAAEAARGGPVDSLVLNAGVSLNVGDAAERFTQEGFEPARDRTRSLESARDQHEMPREHTGGLRAHGRHQPPWPLRAVLAAQASAREGHAAAAGGDCERRA